ncbi:MAG: hypothetical protein CL931_08445 [Deltaproteobacteria bacterium]|nr:hypothetical protein [Deltaproteobacteria bacterium]
MWIQTAALFGALGVVLGAFGAHGLEARLTPDRLDVWTTAVDYHLLHAVALLALALYARATGAKIRGPATGFTLGILLFSGSLYALALGGPRLLGPVTPLGGLCFIAGWLALIPLARRS